MFDRNQKNPQTVIDVGTEVHGPLRSQGFLEIRGLVAGPVVHDGTLLIAAGGRCEGRIQAADLIIAGEARGEATVTGRLQIEATGRLIGDAVYGTITVAAGGIFQGQIRMQESPEQVLEQKPGRMPDRMPDWMSEPVRVTGPDSARFSVRGPGRFPAPEPGRYSVREPARYPTQDEPESAEQPESLESAMLTLRTPLPNEEPQPKPHWGVALLRAAGWRSREAVDRTA